MNSIKTEPAFDGEEGESNDSDVFRYAIAYIKNFAALRGEHLDAIVNLGINELANFLKEFYSVMKETIAQDASSATKMKFVRTGIQEYFAKFRDIDIINDGIFKEANAVFNGVLTSLKSAPRKQYRIRTFDLDDLKKIYLGPSMDLNSPDSLQNKVFFDVCLFICNRGKDFMKVMDKTDFEVSMDESGRRRYVWLKYHYKFSFREVAGGLPYDVSPGVQVGGRMYERKGDPYCPVVSFTKYLNHLHPMCPSFWQRHKRNVQKSDYVWYDHTGLGNSTLHKLMNRICQQAGLPEMYTNHAIRPSCIPQIEAICQEVMSISKPKLMIALPVTEGQPCVQQSREDNYGSFMGSLIKAENPRSPPTKPLGLQDRETVGSESVSSHTSDTKEDDTSSEETTIGLHEAKMRVLEMVHTLEAKDLKAFVNWMKTFQVEQGAGGLVVTCCTVAESSDKKSMQNGEDLTVTRSNPHPLTTTAVPSRLENMSASTLSSGNHFHQMNVNNSARINYMPSKHTVSDFKVKPIEFESLCNTHCSLELCPLKISIPTQDTILFTCVQTDIQVLINKLDLSSAEDLDPVQKRIFFSDQKLDLSKFFEEPPKFDSGYDTQKHENFNSDIKNNHNQEEKFKPVKKRPILDQQEDSKAFQSRASSIENRDCIPRYKKFRIDDICNGLVKTNERQTTDHNTERPLNLVKKL
ncbi:hypothetical protein ACJMK2_028647 [Sinanodonta woodiana]|uniref:DUF3504 domain-containing protein n=1 Tax=Sinanodonta woodiana TaxID=1069815 RepID=A0ABD3X984_SINWO